MPYANLMVLYRKSQKTEENQRLSETRNALLIRHAIENMMSEKPVPLDEYFDAFGVGFAEYESTDNRTAQEIINDVDKAIENAEW